MRCLAGYVSSVHVQLITVWDAQVGRKLCGCMANGMKNAMKHNVNKGMLPFPRRGLICASQVSIGIASCCLPRNLASCLSLHCTIPHFLFFPQVIHNNTTDFLTYGVADSLEWLEHLAWCFSLAVRIVFAAVGLDNLITRWLKKFFRTQWLESQYIVEIKF